MGNASGYEIRHALLSQAKDMAYEAWHAAMNVEGNRAEFENRAPNLIAAPTVDEVKALAESLYEFVQKKS
jgi:hypothetical protein